MNNFELGLFPADNRTACRPGETLVLSVLWALPAKPASLEVRLFWFTRGKGTEDVEVIATEQIAVDAPAGEARVQFVLPAAPYSFSGKLISLLWAAELVAEPGTRSTRFEFTLSPTGAEILLGHLQNNPSTFLKMISARENPFSTDRVLRVRYRFCADDWARLHAALARSGGRGALVGEKGSGKTTLLEDLAIRLRHEGQDVTLIRLSTEFPRPPGAFNLAFFASLTQGDAVLLDGAEQLPFFQWLRFRWRTRKAGIVVVTTHRAGRLRTLHHCTTSPTLLRKLVFALGQELGADEAETLHRRHRGNIREAFRELYDRSAEKNAGTLSFPVPHV